MPDLDVQIRAYLDATSEPLTVDDVLFVPVGDTAVRPITHRTVGRRRWRGWLVAGVAAAVLLVVLGLLPFLLHGGSIEPAGTTIPTPTTTLAPTNIDAESADNPVPPSPATSIADTPDDATTTPAAGSFAWEIIDKTQIPPVEWPGQMGHTESGYFQWVSCETLRSTGGAPPLSELWSTDQGRFWSRSTVPCDDWVFPVANMLVRDSLTEDAAYISSDGIDWSLLTESGPSDGIAGGAEPGSDLWHGSENGYSPGALIWEIDDIGVMYDFSMPWDIGFYAPTGWLFEFDNGLTAISRCCQQDWLRNPMVRHSADNHVWANIALPAFLEQGFDQSPDWWSAFAHQDGIAVASLSNGTETRLWRTTDGLEWNDVTPDSITDGGVWAAGDVWVQGLALFSNNMSGDHFNISTDGLTWTPVEIPPLARSAQGVIRVAGNKIFVFGGNQLIGTYKATPEPPIGTR